MDEAALRSEILRLGPWHHDVEVAPGIRTGDPPPPGAYPPELGTPTVHRPDWALRYLLGAMFEDGFAGRSFLDCGCNGGGYLFAAKAMGAGRVFGFDAREHWIDQARFLARHLPSEGVETAACTLADLAAARPEPFDVTLFSGLLYHLPDPVAGLRLAADLTKELLIVNTATMPRREEALILSPESTIQIMSGVDGLAWLPTNAKTVAAMLAWCGFPHTRLRFDRYNGIPGWRRIALLAARDESTFARWDSHEREAAPWKPPSLPRRILARLLRR